VIATTATDAVVIDSSGWLEYLSSPERSAVFAPYLEGDAVVLIPSIVLYEVRKILLLRESRTKADIFLSAALRRTVLAFDEDLAIKAAEISIFHKLAMADAIIYATALHYNAQLITSDAHFANLPNVKVL
jgi:predicted nucleic acid-binding protein